jgi:hypothetical protein
LKEPTVRCFRYDEKAYRSKEGGHDESNPGCPAPTKVRLRDETPTYLLARLEGTIHTKAYPIIGPATGPINVAAANTHTATPRSTGSQKSARAPPTMATGADAKQPPKKRQSIIVSKFRATATGIWNMANTAYPKNRGRFRPKASEPGPHT